MKVLTINEVKSRVLYIEDINEGLKNYNNGIIVINASETNKQDFVNFLLDINEELVIDYYGNKINSIAFDRLLITLDKEERDYLKKLRETENKEIFYMDVEDKLLDIVVELSLNEILFSSFYLGNNITIWGNYNKKFIIFFKEAVNIENLISVAMKNNLNIEDLREV